MGPTAVEKTCKSKLDHFGDPEKVLNKKCVVLFFNPPKISVTYNTLPGFFFQCLLAWLSSNKTGSE